MNNIINSIKNRVTKMLSVGSILNLSSQYSMDDDGGDMSLQANYKDSLYVNKALNIIKDTVSSIEFKLLEIINTKGEAREVEVHEILDLLYKPNPLQTKSEFLRILVINFKLSGECFIRIMFADEAKKKPVGLVNIQPATVQVKYNVDNTGKLTYQITQNDGSILTLQAEDIIHIKDPDINNPLRGYSVLRPILFRIEAEIKAMNYQTGLFGRNGNPDGVLAIKGVTDVGTLGKLKESFLNSFMGKNERNKVAVVSGEATYTALNPNSNTLDYEKSLNLTRDDIMTALGVPKSLVTSDDVNRANADAGLQQFMQFTIKPMFELILEVLNERFIIPVYGEKYYLDTEKLVTEDKEMLLKESQAGINRWLTVNEVRARFGYEPMPDGDVLNTQNVYPVTTQPIQNAFRMRKNLYFQLKQKEVKQEIAKIEARKSFVSKFSGDPVFKSKFSNAIDQVRTQAEKRARIDSKKYFNEQRDRVLKKLAEIGDNFTTAGDIFDDKLEKEEAKKFILPLYTKNAVEAGNVALIPVKMAHSKANNFVMNSRLFKKLEDRAKLFSDSVVGTTYDQLSEIIGANLMTDVDEVAKQIREKLNIASVTRSELIGRTESCYMTSLGTQMAYDESDLVVGKEWLTSQDALVRPEHQMNDGQVVAKDGVFADGESFPGEDSFNCRCTIAPVVMA